MENKGDLFTPTEVARMLRLTRSGVTKKFHNGEFPNAFQIDKGRIRIPLSDIEAIKHQPFLEADLPAPEAREAV